jgi:hypothetical protein
MLRKFTEPHHSMAMRALLASTRHRVPKVHLGLGRLDAFSAAPACGAAPPLLRALPAVDLVPQVTHALRVPSTHLRVSLVSTASLVHRCVRIVLLEHGATSRRGLVRVRTPAQRGTYAQQAPQTTQLSFALPVITALQGLFSAQAVQQVPGIMSALRG